MDKLWDFYRGSKKPSAILTKRGFVAGKKRGGRDSVIELSNSYNETELYVRQMLKIDVKAENITFAPWKVNKTHRGDGPKHWTINSGESETNMDTHIKVERRGTVQE